VCPARFRWHPEYVSGKIFFGILRVGVVLARQPGMLCFEGLRNIFQEDQAKRDMFVF
jgi:hypothetical protein